jgi:hypothetical protein
MSNYNKLTQNWYREESDDYFSKFIFQYLAFNCYLLKVKYIGTTRDRHAIQQLKSDTELRDQYFQDNKIPKELIEELNKLPIKNVNRDSEIRKYWNNDSNEPLNDANVLNNYLLGEFAGNDDWINLIEFWYTVRNNLFHGAKDPQSERDERIVEYAYTTIKPLVEIVVKEIKHV